MGWGKSYTGVSEDQVRLLDCVQSLSSKIILDLQPVSGTGEDDTCIPFPNRVFQPD